MSNSNSNINNRFTPVRRPGELHTIVVDRRQEHFNGTSLKAYIRTELVKYFWGKPLKHPISGAPLTEDQFLKIALEIATKHPTFLERLWTYSKGFGGESESHSTDMSTMYTRALVHAYSDKSWTTLANVQRILLVAAEALNLPNSRIREEYMLIPDVYARYQKTIPLNYHPNGYIFRYIGTRPGIGSNMRNTALQARYPSETVTRRPQGAWTTYHGNNPLVLIFRRNMFLEVDIYEYLRDTVSRQNRTVHKDFDYLLKHNMVFLPEVLIHLGTMHLERRITTNTFEAIQKILKRGITPNRKVQSEKVEHYVSQIALRFEMKPMIKHINMNPLLSELTRDLYNNERKYYRALLYPDKQLTRERFDFFKWLIKYIKQSTSEFDAHMVHKVVKTIFILTGVIPRDRFPQVSTPLLTDFIKWCVKNVRDRYVSTLFGEVVAFAKIAEPDTMYGDKDQMIGVIKYLRTVSTKKKVPHLWVNVHLLVENISDQNPKAWIKHAVMGAKPKKVTLDPKKLRQQTLLHPEANGEDVVTMERVPLNQAVTLRGHDHNGKIRYVFHRNTVQNMMKNYRWYNNEGRYTPRNVGRGTHPVTRRSFYRENVVPLESRLNNHDRQLYSMLLQKNNAGGNKHAKINSVFNHLEEQRAAERAARRKKAANAKRKRNNASKPNNKGKKVKTNSNRSSTINLTKSNSNANSRGGANRAGPSGYPSTSRR
jgi:hypothetical protein